MKKYLKVMVIIALCGVFISGCSYSGSVIENVLFLLKQKDSLVITYEIQNKDINDEQKDAIVMVMQRRAELYTTEALVLLRGKDKVIVKLPGVDEDSIDAENMGRIGEIEMFVAGENSATVILNSKDIKKAKAVIEDDEETGDKAYIVELTFTDDGAEAFGKATEEHIGEQIVIVYDDEVICSPYVKSAIYDGKAVITGMESYEAADEIAAYINAGTLSTELTLESVK